MPFVTARKRDHDRRRIPRWRRVRVPSVIEVVTEKIKGLPHGSPSRGRRLHRKERPDEERNEDNGTTNGEPDEMTDAHLYHCGLHPRRHLLASGPTVTQARELVYQLILQSVIWVGVSMRPCDDPNVG